MEGKLESCNVIEDMKTSYLKVFENYYNSYDSVPTEEERKVAELFFDNIDKTILKFIIQNAPVAMYEGKTLVAKTRAFRYEFSDFSNYEEIAKNIADEFNKELLASKETGSKMVSLYHIHFMKCMKEFSREPKEGLTPQTVVDAQTFLPVDGYGKVGYTVKVRYAII